MNRNVFFPLVLFLLPALFGCFSAENREDKTQMMVSSSGTDSVPDAHTPEEAVRQLLEGNSRIAHQEKRWLQLSSSSAAGGKPFVLVVNAGAGHVVPEEIFDLPRGSVPVLTWAKGETDWKALEAGMQAGVKVVLVLLPYKAASWPNTANSITETQTTQSIQTVCRQLKAGSSSLSQAVAREHCQLLGGMLHPDTQRLICLPPCN